MAMPGGSSLMGFTAKAKLAAVLLDPKPLATFFAMSDGIAIVVALALLQSANVFHVSPYRRLTAP
jgi:hypothetical protein